MASSAIASELVRCSECMPSLRDKCAYFMRTCIGVQPPINSITWRRLAMLEQASAQLRILLQQAQMLICADAGSILERCSVSPFKLVCLLAVAACPKVLMRTFELLCPLCPRFGLSDPLLQLLEFLAARFVRRQ